MKRGAFITFEGIEGLGKSTHVHTVAEALRARGIHYICTREPGGTPLAEDIRRLLLTTQEPLLGKTELLLLYAARIQHVAAVIEPALAQGHWVLCDRFSDATFAYQGGGRGLAWSDIEVMDSFALGDFKPDATLWFDAPVEVGFSRMKNRPLDRIEQESRDFFERVRAAYATRAAGAPQRFYRIDAAPDLAQVKSAVRHWADTWVPR